MRFLVNIRKDLLLDTFFEGKVIKGDHVKRAERNGESTTDRRRANHYSLTLNHEIFHNYVTYGVMKHGLRLIKNEICSLL